MNNGKCRSAIVAIKSHPNGSWYPQFRMLMCLSDCRRSQNCYSHHTSIRKLNIRLHRGLGAESSHVELHAEVPQFYDEERVNERTRRLRRRGQCSRKSTARSRCRPRRGKRFRWLSSRNR